MFSKHVSRDISAHCHGELSRDEAKRFAEHIISCGKCRSEFEKIKLGISLTEHLPQLAAPDHLWAGLEPLLAKQAGVISPSVSRTSPVFAFRQTQLAAIAAVLLLITSVGIWWLYRDRVATSRSASWLVERLDGTPRIASAGMGSKGHLGVGQWLETDGNSRAQIAVGSIGNVEIDPNTRVRLLETQPTEHRLELARGKMSARIWAPPRLFFVDTPSAVAADLGCAYTLEVDDAGASLLRVTSGWVALELKDRESIVPAGAACRTRPGIGPGTPYFEDAAEDFRSALTKVDFETDAFVRTGALESLLGQSRVRDTLTLWHLLSRVDGTDRVRVYEKIAGFVPPPAEVTREGVLQLDQKMLELWRDQLEMNWSNSRIIPKKLVEPYWQVGNGVNRRMSKLQEKMLPK